MKRIKKTLTKKSTIIFIVILIAIVIHTIYANQQPLTVMEINEAYNNLPEVKNNNFQTTCEYKIFNYNEMTYALDFIKGLFGKPEREQYINQIINQIMICLNPRITDNFHICSKSNGNAIELLSNLNNKKASLSVRYGDNMPNIKCMKFIKILGQTFLV